MRWRSRPSGSGPPRGRGGGRLASPPALRRVAVDEPATLATLLCPADGAAWTQARESVRFVLDAAARDTSDAAVDVVLRWLVSFAGTPGRDVESQAGMVAAGIPVHSQTQLQF